MKNENVLKAAALLRAAELTETPVDFFVFDKINIDGTIFKSPKKGLHGMTFGDFVYADMRFLAYAHDNSVENLCLFLNTIYKPIKKVGKTDFSKKFKRLPAPVRNIIAKNYQSVRFFITNSYPVLFPKNEGETNNNKGGSWLDLRNSIAEKLGDLKTNDSMPVHEVFRFLEYKIKQNDKQNKH